MKKASNAVKSARKFKSRLRVDLAAYVLLIPSVFCVFFIILRPQVLGVVYSFFDMKGYDITSFV